MSADFGNVRTATDRVLGGFYRLFRAWSALDVGVTIFRRRRWTPLVVAAASAAGLASCAAPPPVADPTTVLPSPAETRGLPENPTVTTLIVTEGCPPATGYLVVRSGDLSIGPFEDDSAHPQIPPLRKLWVASQRPGPDEATLLVTMPDGHTETQRRGLPDAQVSNAKQFWPGVIPVPVSGQYRIEATVGADHICVTVTYHR